MSTSVVARIDQAPAWVLHQYPYRETSLIVEVFSRPQGRMPLLAKGARRPLSALRGQLLAFQPLALSWSGKGEVKTLRQVEWQGGVPQLRGRALVCAFYCNELLLRLLPREDAHPALFDAYHTAICALAALPGRVPVPAHAKPDTQNKAQPMADARTESRPEPIQYRPDGPIEPILRRFELQLLTDLGYGPNLLHEQNGGAIHPERFYRHLPGQGLQVQAADEYGEGWESNRGLVLEGTRLQAIAAGDYRQLETSQQAKQLMRHLLLDLLGDKPLHTRQLLRKLQQLQTARERPAPDNASPLPD